MTTSHHPFISTMKSRGLLHQVTDETALGAHLASAPADAPRLAYVGFDPTADSLTIGNLVPIMMLVHWQRAGHKPVVLSGGGTGLIGDPSGKSAERDLLSEDKVRANVDGQLRIFGKLLDCAPGRCGAHIVNNVDWLAKLGYIQVLRDVGKHFSINQMIQRDSVKSRLDNREQGMSYTEFSYMILQAYDYLYLRTQWQSLGLPGPVTMQMGGSDQWGNIVSGIDLIRRHLAATGDHAAGTEAAAPAAFGLTAPLVTKADGGKFGKSEAGAVWLTADRTSPFAYYQFWLNAADADVGRFLRTFTLLDIDTIANLEAAIITDPGARAAQRALARGATELLHGKAEMDKAESAAAALFSGDIAGLSLATLLEVLAGAPTVNLARAAIEAGDGLGVADLLVAAAVCKSKGEARTALEQNSITINGVKATLADKLTPSSLLHNQLIAIRRGKKNWTVVKVA